MITASNIRRLRRKTIWPTREFDAELSNTAEQSAANGKPFYGTIQNATAQDIYRYLSNFIAAVAAEHTHRQPKDIKILDWGGGKGYEAIMLKRLGYDVTLYETDSFFHKDFWEAHDLKVRTSSGAALPFDNKEFDLVVGFGVLEHVPYEYDALKEVNRVLKDDGLFLCFNLPNQYGYLHHVASKRGVKYHDRLYTSRETRWLLKRTGFNTIGRPWRRQLLPKNSVRYKNWAAWERFDLLLCRTPLCVFATSLEFVARKQYTYTAVH